MANRLVLNRAAIRRLLRSPEVARDLDRRARAIAAAVGPGYRVSNYLGRNRARATVSTATWPARQREAHEHRLPRAMRSGGSH